MVGHIAIAYAAAPDRYRTEGAGWYLEAHKTAGTIAASHGLRTEQVCGVIAALSPQMSWHANVSEAIRLIRTGTAHHTVANRTKAERILAGEHPETVLGGFKVRSFFDNLADPHGSDAVTVDRHALDIATGCAHGSPLVRALEREAGYNAVADAYRTVADALGVRPHAVQAATWCAHRAHKVETIGAKGRSLRQDPELAGVAPIRQRRREVAA